MVFLLHGEDSFRMRLRLGELVRALLQRAPIASGDLARAHEVRLGELVGVSLHDARTDPASAIALSGQAQGLFDAPDERRVVVVTVLAGEVGDPFCIPELGRYIDLALRSAWILQDEPHRSLRS